MTGYSLPDFATRFWRKVDMSGGPSSCWPWTGALNARGYGRVQVDGAKYMVTRVSLLLSGAGQPSGAIALHSCDNPPCCNPAHLRWGSHADNVNDMDSRNRRVVLRGDENGSRKHPEKILRGELHPRAKLSADDVRRIRATDKTVSETAKQFGVTYQLVRKIIRRELWRSVA